MFLRYEIRGEAFSAQEGMHFCGDKREKYVQCIMDVHTSDGTYHTVVGNGSGSDDESANRRARADANRQLRESLSKWGWLADGRNRKEKEKERLKHDVAKMLKEFEQHKKP